MGGLDFRNARPHEPPRAKHNVRVVLRDSRSRSGSHEEHDPERTMGLRKNVFDGKYDVVDSRFSATISAMALAMRKSAEEPGVIPVSSIEVDITMDSLLQGMTMKFEEAEEALDMHISAIQQESDETTDRLAINFGSQESMAWNIADGNTPPTRASETSVTLPSFLDLKESLEFCNELGYVVTSSDIASSAWTLPFRPLPSNRLPQMCVSSKPSDRPPMSITHAWDDDKGVPPPLPPPRFISGIKSEADDSVGGLYGSTQLGSRSPKIFSGDGINSTDRLEIRRDSISHSPSPAPRSGFKRRANSPPLYDTDTAIDPTHTVRYEDSLYRSVSSLSRSSSVFDASSRHSLHSASSVSDLRSTKVFPVSRTLHERSSWSYLRSRNSFPEPRLLHTASSMSDMRGRSNSIVSHSSSRRRGSLSRPSSIVDNARHTLHTQASYSDLRGSTAPLFLSPTPPASPGLQSPSINDDSFYSPSQFYGFSRPRNGALQVQSGFVCDCCPKKPKKSMIEEELNAHEAEKSEFACCKNRFKKSEAERHQNAPQIRRYSWSCATLADYADTFHDSPSSPGILDTCGYCGDEFRRSGRPIHGSTNPSVTESDWNSRIQHLVDVHRVKECNHTKKFYRADHFRQHLKHSHAGISGRWTSMLENACMKEEPLPESIKEPEIVGFGSLSGRVPRIHEAKEDPATSEGRKVLSLRRLRRRPGKMELRPTT